MCDPPPPAMSVADAARFYDCYRLHQSFFRHGRLRSISPGRTDPDTGTGSIPFRDAPAATRPMTVHGTGSKDWGALYHHRDTLSIGGGGPR